MVSFYFVLIYNIYMEVVMFIDTHLHLINQDYDINTIVERAHKNGVLKLVVSGSDLDDNFLNIEKLDALNNVFFTCGFHPEFAGIVTDSDIERIEKLLSNPKIVAIGEIGLDYYYSKENKKLQIELFKKQLDLASKYNLPVVIHTRDAFLDTFNILKEYNLKGVIHCFSGSYETALKYISLGYLLGIGGVVTFKNSNLKEVVKKIGLDNIVLETDSPFLSPDRGKKNEPANIKVIAQFLSDFLEKPLAEVQKITTSNAEKVFKI